jgi:shikimate dehydrogenase
VSALRETYSLADLRNWPAATAGLAEPIKLAVLGDPIAHSASPQLQNAALADRKIDARYTRLHIQADELEEAIRLMREGGFIGANLTIPHKLAALPLVDELSEGARRLGAVNTLLFDHGRVLGFNTDGPGFVRALRAEFGVDLHDLRVLVLGAGGGAGRALAAQCADSKCERLALVNRDRGKAQSLADSLAPLFQGDTRLLGPTERLKVASFDDDAIAAELEHTDLIVNCTPLGLRYSDPLPLAPRLLRAHHLVFDTVYFGGQQPTRLESAAREVGARAISGHALLLHQGALAFEIWFNQAAPLEVMRSALTQT